MADENDSQQDKSEKATPFKLQEARKKGDVAKSVEVNSALISVASVICLFALGFSFSSDLLNLSKSILIASGDVDWASAQIFDQLKFWIVNTLEILTPFIVIIFLAGVLANILQIGLIFSFQPLKPSFGRLNPVKGLKNKFSKKTLWETLKVIIKFTLLSVTTYFVLMYSLKEVLYLILVEPGQSFQVLYKLALRLMVSITIVLCIIAIADFIYTKWAYLNKMRMSRRDVKDEQKRREGDPLIKSKRKQIEQELRERSLSVNKVKDADLLITNPVHFAVALKYETERMSAPVVLSVGSGNVVSKMKAIARGCQVPIIAMPELARLLFKKGKLNCAIPEESYWGVAKAYRHLYELKSSGETTSG